MTMATVRHETKDKIIITPERGYSVVMFRGTASLEALIVADDGSEVTRLHIAPPRSDQELHATAGENRSIEIKYVSIGE